MSIASLIDDHGTSLRFMQSRFGEMVRDAWRIVSEAIEAHADEHDVTGRVVLFSGGNDSTVLAHLFRSYATHAAHANTTVGIEATRQFVRDTAAGWGLPLIERSGPVDYETLVKEQGFPGPAMHGKMYQRLKERALRQVTAEFVSNPRRERVLFIAGRRRKESARRSSIPEHERRGSVIWASPLANWSSDDMRIYRALSRDVPRNHISERLGMSGECLCGAFAEPGELDRIRTVDPDCASWIERLQEDVRAAGITDHRCKWGWGSHTPDTKPATRGMLCDCHDVLSTFAQSTGSSEPEPGGEG